MKNMKNTKREFGRKAGAAFRALALALSIVVAFGAAAGCANNNGATTTTTAATTTTTAPAVDAGQTTTTAPTTTQAEGGDSGGSQADDPAAQLITSGYDISVCFESEPTTIDPQLNSSVDGAIMIQHVFEGLMKWTDDGAGNAVLSPGQAERYTLERMDDGTVEYTFFLRDGIWWSDGMAVTAQDFVDGMRRLVDPATAADYAYIVDGIIVNAREIMAGDMTSDQLAVEAVDEKTFKMTTVTECPYLLQLTAFPALFPTRKDLVTAHGDQWTFSPETYVGNGSYKMTSWEHNSFIELSKNENYYDYTNLGPDSIRFALMDDANAMYSAFRNGELDYIQQTPVDEIPGLVQSGEMTVCDYIGTYYVSFQVQQPPFDDKRIREAFTLVIDRENIINNITATAEKPASAFVPAGISDADPAADDFRTQGGDWYSVNPDDYEANCERARQLMADAGYPDGAGFPAVEYLYNTDARHQAIGEAMQADWSRELGVNVTLANQEWGVFLETRKNGDYQIARNGWIADYDDPISFLEMWITGSGNNDAQYSNANFDQLIADSRMESDPAARMQILHAAEKVMQDDFMLGPIYFYTQHYMLNSDVSGMYYTPLGYFFFNYAKKG